MVLRAAILATLLLVLPTTTIHGEPTGWIANQGQIPSTIDYYANGSVLRVYFTAGGVLLSLKDDCKRTSTRNSTRDRFSEDQVAPSTPAKAHAVWIRFVNARRGVIPEGNEPLPTMFNFLHGADPTGWQTGVRSFAEVVYRELWPGIDLIFKPDPSGLEYEIVTQPGAEPSRVRFRYEGADRIVGDRNGAVRIQTSVGDLLARRLGHDGGALIVESIERWTESDPISTSDDPSALQWSTFLGGSVEDYGQAITIESSGGVLIAGSTSSSDFPATPGAYDDSLAAPTDAVVALFDASGSTLLWCTFLGGDGVDLANQITLDAQGNILLTGKTESTDFPTTPGAYDETPSGEADVFVSKLEPTGSSLLWSTYLGDANYEIGFGLICDALDNPIVAGYTQSRNFPTTAGAYDESHNGDFDIFVSKIAVSGSDLLWSSFIGGSDADRAYDLAEGPEGNLFLTAWTQSEDFPTTPGAYDESYNGGSDAYVAKLDASGSALLWCTFLGGSSLERAYGISIDRAGNPIVAGSVRSSDFPATASAYDDSYNGAGDGFVTKLTALGDALLWSSFLGGGAEDKCFDLILDAQERPFVTGYTESSDFPTSLGTYDESPNGGRDSFGAALDASGSSLLWGTYLGGTGWDVANALAIDDSQDLYLLGETTSSDFPTTPGCYEGSHSGITDLFVSKIRVTFASSADIDAAAAPGIRLRAVRPNPSRGAPSVRLELSETREATLRVFDVLGGAVRVLLDRQTLAPGTHNIRWDGLLAGDRPATSGIYYFRLDVGSFSQTRSVILVR